MAPSGSASSRTPMSPSESVAMANSTSSLFLGTRQPAWMNSLHAQQVPTTSRRLPPHIAIPPSSASHRRDSDHNASSTAAQRPAHNPGVSDLQSNRQFAASSVLPSPAPSDDGAIDISEKSTFTHRPSNVAINPRKRPHPPTQDLQPPRRSSDESHTLAVNPSLPQPLEYPPFLSRQPCMAAIDSYILRNGGHEVLFKTSMVVRARIDLLREASFDTPRDHIYLALHQILCLALLNPDLVPHAVTRVRGFPVAIEYLRGLLGDTPPHVGFPEFFSRYPYDMEILRAGSPIYAAAIGHAANCLELMATNYLAFDSACVQQGRVPSVDELCQVLGAYSPILQRLICNAIVKKTFKITRADLYSDVLLSMELAFKAYQADYTQRLRSSHTQASHSLGAEVNAAHAPVFRDIYQRFQARRSQLSLPRGTQSAPLQAIVGPPNSSGRIFQTTMNTNQPRVWPYTVPSQWSSAVVDPARRRSSGQASRTTSIPRSQPLSSMPHPASRMNQVPGPTRVDTALEVALEVPQVVSTPFFARPGVAGPQSTPAQPTRYAMHQANLRSPILEISKSSDNHVQPHYQFVADLALPPRVLNDSCPLQSWNFEVDSDHFAAKAHDTVSADGKPPLRLLTKDSLSFRLRVAEVTNLPTLGQWAVTETAWPANVFFTLNQVRLQVRRKLHHGRDLPVDVTEHVVLGKNTVSAFSIVNSASSLRKRAVAVEIVKIKQYQDITDECHKRRIPAEETKRTLMESLAGLGKGHEERGVEDKDDFVITSKTLNILLLDPFLAGRIWDVPVKGADCRHRECWDLETWLQTRSNKDSATPSSVDDWKCPICGADGRPDSLRVDDWMQTVRDELQRRGQLDARAITVTEDGSWTVRNEGRSNVERRKKGGAGQRGNSGAVAHPSEPDIVDLDASD